MFRWFSRLRWHLAKKRLTTIMVLPHTQFSVSSGRHEEQARSFIPNEDQYERLAALWEDYAGLWRTDYGGFLKSARDYYRCPINSVLDLACGTGLLSRQLARWVPSVVGLDLSKAMLREARLRTEETNIHYAEGDFRDFSLDATFEASICGGDSLNYVKTTAELTNVFRCVRRHLRPGGLFAFDVFDHRFFLAMNNWVLLVDVEEKFEMYNIYDPEARVNENFLVFENAVERHRRIPIEEKDVVTASHAADLSPLEHFSRESYSLLPDRHFYILQAPKT